MGEAKPDNHGYHPRHQYAGVYHGSLSRAVGQFELDFSYTLNENTHIRTGTVDSGASFIAYFFPRIAVCDDISG